MTLSPGRILIKFIRSFPETVSYTHLEAELDQPAFVTMVADACYHAGARKVTVTGKHQALEKLAIRRESVKTDVYKRQQ